MARVSKENKKLEQLQAEKTKLMLEFVLNMKDNVSKSDRILAIDRIKQIRQMIAESNLESVVLEETDDAEEMEETFEEEDEDEEVISKPEFKGKNIFKAQGPKVVIKRGPIVC